MGKKRISKLTDGNSAIPERGFLVGIGASAGGLEALTELIGQLPADSGATFVVVQHLSPTYRSMLVQLLGRETPMLVREISDNLPIVANSINIAPARHNVVIEGNQFRLTAMSSGTMPRPSVNLFFMSLAEQYGESSIAVILSGTGSDGANGLRAVKAAGGYTFAQDPASAKYNGMPQSAIETDCVDWVMTPAGIAAEIVEVVSHRSRVVIEEAQSTNDVLLKKLLTNVKRRTKVDFSGYKEGTLWRRIERRMAANHIFSFPEYLAHVESNAEELDRFCKDVLISVTAFFRDRTAFNRLSLALGQMLTKKLDNDEVRIWVPGCASGEEAYSIAILVAERLGGNIENLRVQVFATDIDLNAMNIARRGVYPLTAVEEMDKTLLNKYFIQHGDSCEIIKSIRDMVVFARQDLVQDPPFLRLDMISCRNLLIYFKTDLQAKILSIFHYALNANGILFLGRSEGIYQQDALFDCIDRDAHMFAPREVARRPPPFPAGTNHFSLNSVVPVSTAVISKTDEDYYRETAAHYYFPCGVLIDPNFDIQFIQGDVSPFITLTPGKPAFDFLSLIRREFRGEVQTMLSKVKKTGISIFGRTRQIKTLQGKQRYRLAIHPCLLPQAGTKFLICFEPRAEAESSSQTEHAVNEEQLLTVKTLEDELIASREHLQSVIEELETSNEEMQALNEEVQAANEELQSSNEELESANEELQATNEELTTINEELQIKTSELAKVNEDIENILTNMGFPLLVIDDDMRIYRINRQAIRFFGLEDSKSFSNLQLNHIRLPSSLIELPSLVQQVLDSGLTLETPLQFQNMTYNVVMSPITHKDHPGRSVVASLVDTTELLAAQEELKDKEQRLQDIMNHSTSMVSLKDLSGRYLFVNARFSEFFRVDGSGLLGRTDFHLFSPYLAEQMRDKDLQVVNSKQAMEFEESLAFDGQQYWLNAIRFPLLNAAGEIYAVCMQASDVTARKNAEEQLQLAARVFDRAGEGIIVTDADARILTVNEAFTRITGFCLNDVIGQKPSILSSHSHDARFYRDIWKSISATGCWQGEIRNRRKNGETYLEWLTINTVKAANGDVINYVGIFSDITAIKESQRQIEFLATHDPLTSLPNRTLFNDRFSQALANAQRHRHGLAVMFLDLDNFKLINDTLGHDAGDKVVIGVGERLLQCIRAGDTVARFGGDEFAILLDSIEQHEINLTARRIVDCLVAPFRIESEELFVSCSVGVSIYPNDGEDFATLIKHADVAMYQAKEKGKNNFQFFCDAMRQQFNERLLYENALRHAIEGEGFYLLYQPQIAMNTGRLDGMEALIRWNHSELGLVGPDKFIPIAEQAGLIDRIGEWLLNAVFNQISLWRRQGIQVPRVSLNLSPRHFRKTHVPSLIKRYISAYQVPAHLIGIEFTESALIEDAEHTSAMLWEMKKMGLHLSLDDFGTGYSSLVYLKRYPIDEIKIDRSFIQDLLNNLEDRAIVLAILAMSQALGLRVVAEGVENLEQYQILDQHHCQAIQGYLFSKPLPVDEVAELIKSGNSFKP